MKMKNCLALCLALALVLALVPGVALAEGDAAQVGNGEAYSTVQEAINNANGTKVTLLRDVTESITINSGTVTLDLGGYTLTAADKDAIYVSKDANLTVTGSGTVQAASNGYAAVFNNGTTALNGGTYTRSAGTWYTIVNHGESMTIESGVTVTNMNNDVSSLVENGYSSYTGSNERNNYVGGTNAAAPTLTINDGSFSTAGYNAVKNDEGGVLQINGGTYTSQRAEGAVIMNWNKATISGGTFTATKENAAVVSNGTWGAHATGQLKITDGNFIVAESATGATVFSYGEGSGAGGSLTVSGGSFDGTFIPNSYYTTFITSCSATTQVPESIIAGGSGQLKLTSRADDTYWVGPEAQLQQAASTAQSGDAIEVLNGNVALTNLSNGVTVRNSGTGNVTANGESVAPNGGSITISTPSTPTTPSTPSYSGPSGVQPSITSPTASQLVNGSEGMPLTLAVQASNATNFQWYVDFGDGQGFQAISGATASSLTLWPTLADHGNIYRCLVSNGNGSVYSPTFTLSILGILTPPKTGGAVSQTLAACLLALGAAGAVTALRRRSR